MLKFNKEAWIVFFLLAFVFGYFYQDPAWNGNSRIALSLAVVREGRLTIDTYHDDVALGLATKDQALFNGHYYSDKAIGSSIFAVLAYLPIYFCEKVLNLKPGMDLIKQLITFLGLGIPSALCGSLMYLVCEYISKSRLRAFIVTLAIALGTMSFPFSVIFFGHQLAAAALFGAFFLIFRIKVLPEAGPGREPFWIGLVMGLAIITEYPAAIVALLLVGYYFIILWQKQSFTFARAFLLPILGGLVPLGVMVLYNLACYQSPFASGYEFLTFQPYQEGMSKEFFGIGRPSLHVLFYETFHPAVGIFWQSPVLLMTAVGAFFMWRDRKYRAELGLAGLVALGFLAWNSGYYMWWGGNSFAPRHLIPMLPFLCLPLIFVPKKYFIPVILLTGLSVAQMSFVAASDILAPDAALQNINRAGVFDYSMLYSYILPHLIDGGFAWNFGKLLGLKQWASLLPLGIGLAVVSGYMALSGRRGRLSLRR